MDFEFENIEVPKELDDVIEKSMKRVRTENKSKNKRKWIAKTVGVAACLSVVLFGGTNPSFAAKLPLVGHIFETMQDDFSYGGDYRGIGKVLTSEDNIPSGEEGNIDETINNKYIQKADGLTITLSEVYCNKQAIYLSMEIKSDEVIPDIYAPQLFISEKYSFNKTTFSDCPVLNGERIDDYTYAGLIRLDLNDKRIDSSEIEKLKIMESSDADYKNLIKEVDIPEEFTVELTMNQFRGGLKNPPEVDYGKTQEELENMSEEEWIAYMKKWDEEHPNWEDESDVIYNGTWKFSLDISINQGDTQVIDLENQVKNGIGFSSVVKDRFEITVYGLNSLSRDMGGYFPVFLDADGRLMDYGDGGCVNTVAINDSDISTVYLYLIENNLWLNSLKGEWWKTSDGLTDEKDIDAFKKLLDDNCVYQTEVHFK